MLIILFMAQSMANSFHYFPFLPLELQTLIWSFSVRSSKPGIQVFSLSSNELRLTNRNDTSTASRSTPFYLSAPKWSFNPVSTGRRHWNDATASWTKNNPSTYLIDCGLGGTCRQSRSVLKGGLDDSKFAVIRTWANSSNQSDSKSDKSESLASQHRSIVVLPSEDLFILQLDDPGMFDCYLLEDAMPDVTAAGSPQLRQVAWQYHPIWASSLNESTWMVSLDSLCSYIVYGIRSGGLKTLWLINYLIKRKQLVPSEKELNELKPHVFETGDFRFIEVPVIKDRFWDEVVEDDDPHLLAQFLSFVDQLQQLITYTLSSLPSRIKVEQEITVKILACEGR